MVSKRIWIVLPVFVGLVAALAWTLPRDKPGAVLGRLSYGQFWLAAAATLAFGLTASIALSPAGIRRKAAFRGLLAGLGALAALLACELAACLAPPIHWMDNPFYLSTRDCLTSDPNLPFVRPAGLRWEGSSRGDLAILNNDEDPYARKVRFATDKDGFRNSQDLAQADLVFLGDSFTEAGNVPEDKTFVRLSAARLNMTGVNLGRAGYTPPTELIVLRNHALERHPRIVIWQIAESNDLTEAILYEKWLEQGRPPYTANAPSGVATRAESWRRRSPTYRIFSLLRRPAPWTMGPSGTFRDSQGTVRPMRMLDLPDPRFDAGENAGYPLLLRALEDGSRLLREKQIELFVLMVPMKFRVMAPAVHFEDATLRSLTEFGLNGPDWDKRAERTLAYHLGKDLASQGIAFEDATEALRRSAKSGVPVYLSYDTHLSPEGHKVLCRLITGHIRPGTGE